MAESLIKGLPPVHPGAYLKEMLPSLETTTQAFATNLRISRRQLYKLMDGESAINASMALRLARATGVRAEMWLNLQQLYDLKTAEAGLADELAAIKKVKRKAEPAAAAGIPAVAGEPFTAGGRVRPGLHRNGETGEYVVAPKLAGDR